MSIWIVKICMDKGSLKRLEGPFKKKGITIELPAVC